MELVPQPVAALDLTSTPIHLAPGSRALAIEGFSWDADVLAAYADSTSDHGGDGRLVMVFATAGSWDHWERHPAGEEVVVCLSGRFTVIRESAGGPDRVELRAGQAMVNPAGVWHTADVHEPGQMLAITPGLGTEHRPR